jgi:2-methylcitrate dehydratase PrpD
LSAEREFIFGSAILHLVMRLSSTGTVLATWSNLMHESTHDMNPSRNGNLTRRSLLERGAMLTAAGFFRPLAAFAADDISPVMTKLSEYMADARNHALPDSALRETKHHVLDTFAAMVSGSELKPGKLAIEFARSYGGEKTSTVVASSILVGPIEAALANGQLAHSDESDDDFTTGGAHPGCAVIPASLAVGEKFEISGTHFLRAAALGYDLAMRAMRTVGPGMKETHPLVGTMGASAAGGCAASLNAQQMRWLLDYAAQQAGAGIGAWRRDTEHIEKAFVFGGMGARNGTNAALAVQAGWTGVNDVLSGPNNFVQAYNPKTDAAGFVDQLGELYGVTQTTLKKWTTGGPIQAPLDAMENIQKKHPFTADQVKQVVVRAATSAAYTVNNREMPDICLQHVVAVILLDKTVSFRAAHDKARMQDPAVLKERAKVQLVPDEELEKLIPVRVAIVEITLNDGTQLSDRVEHVRGTPENPMSREEVVAKANDLMTPVLGASRCTKLIDRVLNLDAVKDIRELRPLLQRA